MKDLKSFLAIYLPFVDAHIRTDINSGGCGIFATGLSKALNSMKEENEIVVILSSDEHPTCEKNMVNIMNGKKGNPNNCAPAHIMVKYKDDFFDSDGNSTKKLGINGFSSRTHSISLELMEEMDKPTNHGWNNFFDRSTIPDIDSYLEAIPEAYEEWQKGKDYIISEENKTMKADVEEQREMAMIDDMFL